MLGSVLDSGEDIQRICLARHTSAGILDAAFGKEGGMVVAVRDADECGGWSLATDSEGRYLVAG